MFQTFSGNSRRPRQVNLSGQNTNPFSASSWSPSGSGTQRTVAAAQQERQIRQQERDRLNASKKLQRVWRGHKVRRDLAESRRKAWDDAETGGGNFVGHESRLAEQLQILVAFFSPKRQDDIRRLATLSEQISVVGYKSFLYRPDVQAQLSKLANITLEALQAAFPQCPNSLLQLLLAVLDSKPSALKKIYRAYYKYIATFFSGTVSDPSERSWMLSAICVPLVDRGFSNQNNESIRSAYSAFALELLTSPHLISFLGSLDDLAATININHLSAVITQVSASGKAEYLPSEHKLWLLAHFIAVHRLQGRNDQDPEFVRALSFQISSSSSDILGRMSPKESDTLVRAGDEDEESPGNAAPSLHPFIREQLLSLVNQTSISGLLNKFNGDQTKGSISQEEDASLLSSYALTLLRIFPGRGDEIRMWLFQGSMTTSSGIQLPALKFFWQATSGTKIFSAIKEDSKAALNLLRPQTQSNALTPSQNARDHEWRTILLFLELYNFVLRFTDDEEFLSAGNITLGDQAISRLRESALPLKDVRSLTIFLKNLAFTAFYNASELLDDDQSVTNDSPRIGSLGTYFGSTTTSIFRSQPQSLEATRQTFRPFAGIAGMNFPYVRTIVTGVMRMLYERDSRRRFLPKDHWLMTSRFDMEGFIPAVVAEEERLHEYHEEGGDGEEEDEVVDEDESQFTYALIGMERSRRAQHIEQQKRKQQKAARARYMAQVGPRLEILQNMPFAIPFETRVNIFRQFVHLDQLRRRGGNTDPDIWRMSMAQNAMANHPGPGLRPPGREVLSRHHAKIRRDQVFDDAFEAFYQLGEGLKEPIQITFVDKFDTVEAGIDGGGVTKEFLTSITNEAFRADDGPNLFVTNDQNLLYPNPSSIDERREFMKAAGIKETSKDWKDTLKHTLQQYEFLGRVVGKCLYEGILIDVGFAGFFLLKWATAGASNSESGYRPNINDLRDFDEGLYQGLLQLKNYDGNVEDFALDFTIQDTYSFPGAPTTQTITRELIPNGANNAVSNENRPIYVSYVARHRLLVQPYHQTQAFLKGLSEIIKPSWLSMFNQTELQTLIRGDTSEINVEDLRNNTIYGGVYEIGDDGLEHPTVQLFWKVMEELDDSDRRKVLKYVTSTPRAPLSGFSQLNPRFSIRDAGGDEERLPSTSTCVNLLKLPRYSTASTLRHKLLYAVNSGAGFDLS